MNDRLRLLATRHRIRLGVVLIVMALGLALLGFALRSG